MHCWGARERPRRINWNTLLFHIPWHDMLLPKPSWAEKIIRPVLVYVALLLAFRFMSKRDLTQNTTFDLLIVLLLSNIVQNALIGEDNSILGSLAGALTLLLLSTGAKPVDGEKHQGPAHAGRGADPAGA